MWVSFMILILGPTTFFLSLSVSYLPVISVFKKYIVGVSQVKNNILNSCRSQHQNKIHPNWSPCKNTQELHLRFFRAQLAQWKCSDSWQLQWDRTSSACLKQLAAGFIFIRNMRARLKGATKSNHKSFRGGSLGQMRPTCQMYLTIMSAKNICLCTEGEGWWFGLVF